MVVFPIVIILAQMPERVMEKRLGELCNDDPAVVVAAEEYFIREGAKTAVRDVLIKGCTHSNSFIREQAISLIGRIKIDEAIPTLEHILIDKKENQSVRAFAANSLGLIGEKSLPALCRALGSQDEDVPVMALDGISRIDKLSCHTEVLEPIICLFRNPSDDVRNSSLRAILSFGKDALPALKKKISDPDERIRVYSAQAMLHLGNSQGTEGVLAAALKSKDNVVKAQVCDCLFHYKCITHKMHEGVLDVLKGQDSVAASWSAAAISTLGPNAKFAEKSLRDALKHSDARVRSWSAVALGNIGPCAQAAVPELIGLLCDKGEMVAYSSVIALGKIGANAKAAVPHLRALLPAAEVDFKNHLLESLMQIEGSSR